MTEQPDRYALRYTRKRVLEEVYLEPYVSTRESLVRHTGHTPERVDIAIQALIAEGVIYEDGEGGISLTRSGERDRRAWIREWRRKRRQK